jgi:hypothetical protein
LKYDFFECEQRCSNKYCVTPDIKSLKFIKYINKKCIPLLIQKVNEDKNPFSQQVSSYFQDA